MKSSADRNWMGTALGLLLAGLLQACGGGGGSDTATPTTPPAPVTPSPAEARLSIAASAINSETERSPQAAPVDHELSLGLSGLASNASVHFTAVAEGEAVETASPVSWQSGSSQARAKLRLRSDLAPGQYSGTWTLSACHDPLCQRHLAGSPQTLRYQHSVTPGFEVSEDRVEFSSSTEDQAAATSVKIGLPTRASGWIYQLLEQPGGTDWLQHRAQGDTLLLQPAAGLTRGEYRAEVKISPVGVERPAHFLRVKATVESQVVVLYTPSFALRSLSETPGASMRIMPTAKTPEGLSWTASTSTPWLRLEQASRTALIWRLVPEAFDKLANQESHLAAVNFEFSHGVPARTVSFRLIKRLTQIDTVDDSALQAGRAGSLILLGTGFGEIGRALPQLLSFGTLTPTAIKLLDNGRIRVDLPAQPAGRYEATLGTASGLPGQRLSYTVR
ncbi:hypothetical protein HNP55_003044 [Paucibacter oligotrophus]|uniref:Uncharacterized protein n=1 Tax=Roseateles oligotrophus TaxID=1769250 RepID=A0A840L8J5_9BURK|nr:hypothetical protein [Roseateles oligotrophus]MBB4844500.1 hypothetical protein [Roseateles oligotrophus]